MVWWPREALAVVEAAAESVVEATTALLLSI
jgi:hypothetical protein